MKQKWVKYTVIYVLLALFAALVYYIFLPPINAQSTDFWIFATFVLLLGLLPFGLRFDGTSVRKGKGAERLSVILQGLLENKRIRPKKILLFALIPLAVILVGTVISSTFFNATSYAGVIDVTEAVFKDDMPETDTVTNIALMDTQTAAIVGNRTLGSLSHVVSQYEISDYYTQINFNRTPKKVANLEYAGFFKWLGNRENGIPGYVMVDPVTNTAEYVELSSPMKYVESGYFGDDLMRRLRFLYPTKIFGEIKYEVDDEGNPVYIVPCMAPKVALFGAYDVKEVIIFDPTDGTGELYSLNETPAWIDNVYDGYLATEKYNWKGMYSGGFWNSVIGNKDCKVTTDDFGYIIIGDDVWYFTGVTSVNSDQSNIGFIISNARTGEYKFYPVIGAEEHSAMGAAEGEVQEKGYVASFPALINVKGQATYIMVLKDSGGLVKLYALVNVEKYSLVATATTQEKAMAAYRELLFEEGLIEDEDSTDTDTDTHKNATLSVSDILLITTDGESVVYLTAMLDGEERPSLFKLTVSSDESILLVQKGDKLTVSFTDTDTPHIYQIASWSFLAE